MPLKIIIVGAGIGGLSAAVALRQAGHSVTVFEKSKFAAEVGAALVLSSNGSRVLQHLGFDFERGRGTDVTRWDTIDGISMATLASLDLAAAPARYGAPIVTIHRVDLHTELLRLAAIAQPGLQALQLHLASKVVDADPAAGTVTLDDGAVHAADLIVAADGLHSVLKPIVLGKDNVAAAKTGLSAFRFLIPTAVFEADPDLKSTLEQKCKGVSILADTTETVKERHLVWYDCQDGHVQNLVGIHPTCLDDDDKEGDYLPSLLREFQHFHPTLLKIIERAADVSRWPLHVHDPIQTWSKGKILLIGDAAHPMLPFGGQGSNQAIEDAGALGYLLDGVELEMLPQRIKIFEAVRQKRAARVQILSKVRSGREQEIQEELQRYADPPGSAVPQNFPERNAHDYGFDVYKSCAEALARSQSVSRVPSYAGDSAKLVPAKMTAAAKGFRDLISVALSAVQGLLVGLIAPVQRLINRTE